MNADTLTLATVPTLEHSFDSMAAIRQLNKDTGHYFFAPSTMRFFASRVCGGVRGGDMFITSEQFSPESPRMYAVRRALPSGAIETLSDFEEFSSLKEAKAFVTEVKVLREWLREAAALLGTDN